VAIRKRYVGQGNRETAHGGPRKNHKPGSMVMVPGETHGNAGKEAGTSDFVTTRPASWLHFGTHTQVRAVCASYLEKPSVYAQTNQNTAISG
jgi:hypothetical protein